MGKAESGFDYFFLSLKYFFHLKYFKKSEKKISFFSRKNVKSDKLFLSAVFPGQ